MIDDLGPYPAYVVDGNGVRQPAHWESEKLRRCGSIVGGMTPTMSERRFWGGTIPWASPKDMKVGILTDATDHITESGLRETALRLLPPDSVVLVVRGMILARRIPIAVTAVPMTINQDMKAIVPNARVSGSFLAYALEASKDSLEPLIDEAGHGTKRLPTQRWREHIVPLPPREEQAAIVRFLDHTNHRIDAFIRGKRKLIGLLREQHSGIVQGAVLRGLDDRPLRSTGVPWIPQVPSTWAVRRLKSLVSESVAGPYGSSLTKAMYSSSGYRVYGQQQVIPDNFGIGDYYISSTLFEQLRRYRTFPDDILISVMGTVGKVAVVPKDAEPGIINPRLVRYRLKPEVVSPRFMQLAVQSEPAQRQLDEGAKGTTMDGLNMRILGDLNLAIPPFEDQERIVSWVRAEGEPFIRAIERTEREITLMREYRTRLISDVVTGQLDVREAARTLPDLDPAATSTSSDPDLDPSDEEEADAELE